MDNTDLKKFLNSATLVDESRYERFHQKNICFARAYWDEDFKAYQKGIQDGAPSRVQRNIPGYSRVDYALQSAAWTVYAGLPAAFSWKRESRTRDGEDPDSSRDDPITAAHGPYAPPNPAEASAAVKRAGQVFGACATGIAEINPAWIYSHRINDESLELPEGVTHAIVMLIEMDDYAIRTSPSIPAGIATGSGYSRMALASASMAEFLRNLGWQGIAAGNDKGLSVPLAVDAGLGEFGRNGLLIHPTYGQRVRICKVFTDLSLAPDKPISFGAKRFCLTCMKCAEHCPSKSISFDRDPTWESPFDSKSNADGTCKWYVNADSCYAYWTANTADCSNCIRVCPYTKVPGFIHDVPRFLIHRLPWFNRLWVAADTLFGYDKQTDPVEFWDQHHWLDKP